jgi:maltose/moltooligosaccharide transporter
MAIPLEEPRNSSLPVADSHATSPAPPFPMGQALGYSAANFGAQCVYALWTTGIPLFLATYHLPPEVIGVLSNERSLVGAVVQPIVGRISDRTRTPLGRRRPFFLIGVPLMSIAIMILATHPSFWLMLGIMTIAAFFLSIAWDPYMALMADIFPPAQRGRVGGLIGLSSMLGAVVILLFSSAFWAGHEIWVFGLVIVLLITTFAITFVTVKEPPLAPHVAAPPAARPNPVAYVRDLLMYREAAKYTLGLFLFWVGNGGTTPFVTLFAVHALHATESESFLLPLAFVATTALFAIPGGMLADRIGKKPVMSMGLVLFGLGAIIGSQSTDLVQGTIALAVIGIGNAALSQINPLLTELIPKARCAELIGTSSAVTSFAQPVGSLAAGSVVAILTGILGQSDAYRGAFVFAGAMILLGALVLQTVHPERVPQE